VRPWYESAFGREYLELYSHRNEQEARADVRAILDLIQPLRAAPLLDLGCGSGRHLLALCREGFADVTGLDLSRELLDVARERLQRAGCDSARLVLSDMRDIPFENHFATILSLFTSFGYFPTEREDARVLASALRSLRPDGVLLIDTLSREWTTDRLVPRDETTSNGTRFSVTRAISVDGTRVEKEVRVLDAAGAQRTYRESVRMYTVEELADMLKRAGFSEARFYGSLDGAAYDRTSRRLIAVARKEAE
jgi:ubiquinone/menaquinone biosynthesis C-methylase UbiE